MVKRVLWEPCRAQLLMQQAGLGQVSRVDQGASTPTALPVADIGDSSAHTFSLNLSSALDPSSLNILVGAARKISQY